MTTAKSIGETLEHVAGRITTVQLLAKLKRLQVSGIPTIF